MNVDDMGLQSLGKMVTADHEGVLACENGHQFESAYPKVVDDGQTTWGMPFLYCKRCGHIRELVSL